MVKLATTLLLWKISRGGLKLTFFMHHSAFSWKPLQKRENNRKIVSAVSLVSVGTRGLAVVEAQALNATLVISVGEVWKLCPEASNCKLLERNSRARWGSKKIKGILKDGWRRSEQEGRKAAALSSGCCLVRRLRRSVNERPRVCKTWWVRSRWW